MTQGRRHVQAYIGTAEHGRLQREAAARGVTISKCVADCLAEYFALRAELATAIEAPGGPGDAHNATIIHSLLARSEERLVATLDRRATDALSELRRLRHMLDRFVMAYFIQARDLPSVLREKAAADAQRRYTNYVAAVNERLASDDPESAAQNTATATAKPPAQDVA
jgi:hypothetical protein